MKLLIDADLVAYRCAASAENTDAQVACDYATNLIDLCVSELKADSYECFLTGDTNFRYQVFPEYKVHRLKQAKPTHLAAVKDFLIREHGAVVSEGCEADDMMGIAQDKSGVHTCIVSLDKDMLMVPGQHYSWYIEGGPVDKRWTRSATHRIVEPLEGLRWFYTQLVVGDPSDGIKGIPGLGKVAAAKMLADCLTEREMFDRVRDAYSCDEEMLMNGQVLYIWQKENDIWKFPFETEDI